jgi:hypothetical protein
VWLINCRTEAWSTYPRAQTEGSHRRRAEKVRYSAPLLAVIANWACLTPLVAASKPAKR